MKALILPGIAAGFLLGNSPAATIPGPLLVDQAILSNDRFTGHSYGTAIGVDGDIIVVGVEGGDPFASAHVYERTGTTWRRMGRLSDSRASTYDGFGIAVAVDNETIAVGDNLLNNAAYAFVRSGGPQLNAWNITDNNSSAVAPSYIVALSAEQHAALTTNAWRYSVRARLVHDFGSGVCMYFSYGNASRRYLFFLDFNANGDLLAQLAGASPAQFLLTTNGAGADDYHQHELEFNPATGQATYRFDGMAIHTWTGEALSSAAGIRWGAGSTPGRASMNVHEVRFEMNGVATLATYDAGEPGSAPGNLDPTLQGWSPLSIEGAANTSQEGLMPDIATLWMEQARITAIGGAPNDSFGRSIDISGDTMVVGAPGRSGGGAAYVFVREGSNWMQQAMLTASPSVANADFGQSVAIDGDTIVVGAPNFGVRGRAYAFSRNGSNWTQEISFAATAPDDDIGNGFGASVDIEGDTIVIGAPRAAAVEGQEGAVYVSRRSGGVWGAFTQLLPENDYRFGYSVAISGDSLVVGCDGLAGYVFVRQGVGWDRTVRREYPNYCEAFQVHVAVDGETIVAGVPGGCSDVGLRAGAVFVQVPGFSDAVAVADHVNQMLFYPAAAGGDLPKEQAAFRYKHLLYGESNGLVRARFEMMSTLYGPAERQRAQEAEDLVWRSLELNPTDTSLGNLLLDIYYCRAEAETILAQDTESQAQEARYGAPISTLNPPASGFLIDNEIALYDALLKTNRFALQGYFHLLQRDLESRISSGTTTRWATHVIGFSTEYVPAHPSWNAVQALGEADTYPEHGDIGTAWASALDDNRREFIELGYDTMAPIDSVSVYETYNPGAVDKISVRDPYQDVWTEVWSGPAAAVGATSRIFTVTFPMTSFPVDAIRLDLNSPAVPGWNEIDAVSIPGPGPLIAMTESDFGYRLFQSLVPTRAQMAATYTNGLGSTMTVGTNAVLFDGFKDLVLLFNQLGRYGNNAAELGRLLFARANPGDLGQAKQIAAEAQQFVFLQGNLLKNMFTNLPPEDDPSGLVQSIRSWNRSLTSLTELQQALTGRANPLGFDPDFLMLSERISDGGTQYFDSFDAFAQRLDPASSISPISVALADFQRAHANYEDFRGYEDQYRDQLGDAAGSYEDRLFHIVGAYPGTPAYSDNPTNNRGSELDQQYRSVELAQLRIRRNATEISNLKRQVQIEVSRATAISNAFINFGDQRASLAEEMAHAEAVQSGANALADALSVEKLTTGLFIGFLVNAAVQAGTEEWKGNIEARKERLAGLEQATIEGINSAATVKTLLLQMNTLTIDSQEAALLLQQEIARLVALYREKQALEARIDEANAELSNRYYADPIHRIIAETNLIQSNFSFEEAQKWVFFLTRAFYYKWNTPFVNNGYLGRNWTTNSVFKVRNAAELHDLYLALVNKDATIGVGLNRDDFLSTFSVRKDFFGYEDGGTYVDPVTLETVDAVEAFRRQLRRMTVTNLSDVRIEIDFSTVREKLSTSFFLGPRFNSSGQPVSPGRYLDKIVWLKIKIAGNHTTGFSQANGDLTYGGTSFIRRQSVGSFDPARPDRVRNEMNAFSTRFWFFDTALDRFRFNDGFISSGVQIELSANPEVPPSVTEINDFAERSVAASNWHLSVPIRDRISATDIARINDMSDILVYFFHQSVSRQLP